MRKLVKRLTIDKEFVFIGEVDDFKARIKNLNEGITCWASSDHQYTFLPSVSFGTMTRPFNLGISVNAVISPIDQERLSVKLKTSLRPEHFFIILAFIIVLVSAITSDESAWRIVFLSGLWVVSHALCHFIYRLQEEQLIDKLTTKLKLSDVLPSD